MTKYFAVNALNDGAKIRVNAIAPGGIVTHGTHKEKIFKNFIVRDVRWVG